MIGALEAAGFRISTSGAHERRGIVHRLDVGFSGVMVVAVSNVPCTLLKRAFKQRTVDKGYHAVVQGHLDPPISTIDAPIGRHRGNDWKFAVTASGKPSITHYETLEMFASASLLDVHLETGRTHQIGCTSRPCTIRAAATRPMGPTRRWPRSWVWNGSGCTPRPSVSPIRPTVAASSSAVTIPTTCNTHSASCAADLLIPGQRRWAARPSHPVGVSGASVTGTPRPSAPSSLQPRGSRRWPTFLIFEGM